MLVPSVSGGICRCHHQWCTPAGALILVSGTNRKKYITQVSLISVRFSACSYITQGSTFLQVNLQIPKWVTGRFRPPVINYDFLTLQLFSTNLSP